MEFRITLGSVLRLINTFGAAKAFAEGSYITGCIFVVVILVTIWLESLEALEKP